MINVIITGVGGRMGAAILRLACEDPGFEVVAGLEANSHPLIGKGLDLIAGATGPHATILDDITPVIGSADVIIDFTEPSASERQFMVAAEHGKPIVIGTTGFSAEALARMKTTHGGRAVIAPNMSVGVNVMFDLVSRAARALGEGYDVEIVELHHKWKKDAPSGTALKLRNTVAATDASRGWTDVPGRSGAWGERKPDEIGIFAVRGGDIVGEHTVFFAGLGERIEITHRAYSRDNFARGALLAAKWIVNQEPGIYDMQDVLGLTSSGPG